MDLKLQCVPESASAQSNKADRYKSKGAVQGGIDNFEDNCAEASVIARDITAALLDEIRRVKKSDKIPLDFFRREDNNTDRCVDAQKIQAVPDAAERKGDGKR